jgi:hypothetical protein
MAAASRRLRSLNLARIAAPWLVAVRGLIARAAAISLSVHLKVSNSNTSTSRWVSWMVVGSTFFGTVVVGANGALQPTDGDGIVPWN